MIFLFSKKSRPAVGPTQSPIQWAPGMKSSLFSDVTHRILVIIYRRFGTTYRVTSSMVVPKRRWLPMYAA